MYGGIRMTTSANASSRPWISSTVIAAVAPPSSRPQAVDEAVELDPARRLDQHDVAVAEPRPQRRRGPSSAIAAPRGSATRPSPASRRAVGDRRRSGADDDEQVDDAGRPPRRPRGGRPRARRRARASRRGPRRAGRAARPAGRARRPPSPARRCSCRRRSSRRRARTSCAAMRRRPAACEPAAIVVEVEPGGEPDGGRRPARCGPTAGRASGSSTGRRSPAGDEREAHPVEPGRLDVLGPRRRRRRRSRRSRSGRTVRAAMPADRSGRRR